MVLTLKTCSLLSQLLVVPFKLVPFVLQTSVFIRIGPDCLSLPLNLTLQSLGVLIGHQDVLLKRLLDLSLKLYLLLQTFDVAFELIYGNLLPLNILDK